MAHGRHHEWAVATVPQYMLDLMPAAALRAMARFHQSVAKQMETIAEIREGEERRADQRRRRREALREVWTWVENMRANGLDIETAMIRLAFQFNVPVDTVRANYELGAKLAGRMRRARRDREITRLARLGLTNAEIGAKLAPPLHAKSVARILRAALAGPEASCRSESVCEVPAEPRAASIANRCREASRTGASDGAMGPSQSQRLAAAE